MGQWLRFLGALMSLATCFAAQYRVLPRQTVSLPAPHWGCCHLWHRHRSREEGSSVGHERAHTTGHSPRRGV